MTTKIHMLLLLSLPLGSLLAQPSLRITSPADGTTLSPGETLTVTVDASPSTGAFQGVFILSEIGSSNETLNAPPYRFTVPVKKGLRPREYQLVVTGFTSPGNLIMSYPITIFIERADSPISIIVYPTIADFTMDQKRYFSVTGTYADRTEADLSQSSRIKYFSSAPGVATVNAVGIVTPVAPGSGTITISYDQLKLEVPLTVRPSQR